MSPKDEQKLVKTNANKGRRKKAKTPPKELKEWTIRRQPDVQRRAELSDLQTAATDELGALERQIEDSYADHKRLKKRVEGEIESVRERLDELATENKHGVVVTQLCHRARVDDDWVYTDPTTGEVLYREPAADGKQLSLDDAKEKAQAEKTATSWPWRDPSWHPFVRERQAEAQDELDGERAVAEQHRWYQGYVMAMPIWRDSCSPKVREAWPVHSQLWFRELAGDWAQLVSVPDGAYQVREERRDCWAALHGEDRLYDFNTEWTYPSAGAAIWRCVESDETLAEQRERAAEARATLEERMAPPSQRDTKAPATAELRVIGPCPLPSRANMRGHWSSEHKLVGQQHARVESMLARWCGERGTRLQMLDGELRLPLTLPCAPPLLVTMVRIPRKGGRTLDSGDNDAMALKAVRDKVALMLGTADDSVPWITWEVQQRKRQDGDPSNVGTELLELTIGPAGGEG